MAWSPPALKRRHGSLQRTGDYATTRFHHLRDTTPVLHLERHLRDVVTAIGIVLVWHRGARTREGRASYYPWTKQVHQRHAVPFDLLVTDLCMSGSMNGVALAADWQRRASSRPVLLVSGDVGDFLDGSLLGLIVTVLQKPFRRACLTSAVQRLLQDTRAAA